MELVALAVRVRVIVINSNNNNNNNNNSVLSYSFLLLTVALKVLHFLLNVFYQRVSIVSYASAGIARAEMSVRMSVCPSHSGIVSKRRKLAS